jgi:phosphoribosylaminoimidazole-succinocarboxamide synthase
LLSAEDFDQAALMCARLFAFGQGEAARRGLILVDTKYEFGLDADGRLVLGDEVHTPDSSRFWMADSYPARFAEGLPPIGLDKDVIRRWLISQCDPYAAAPLPVVPDDLVLEVASRYGSALELITGADLAWPDPTAGRAQRLRANLQLPN